MQQLTDAAEVTRVPLPPRSPNLNAYAERWVRSLKEEWTSDASPNRISRDKKDTPWDVVV